MKVLRWSNESFRPSNDWSCKGRNFEGIGHSRIAMMKGEFVFLTIRSKLRYVFSLIALSSSISFLISLRRSELSSCGMAGRRCSSLLWLSPSSSRLVLDRSSSYCSHNLISWFCRVSSSTLSVSVRICRANVAESQGVLGSI